MSPVMLRRRTTAKDETSTVGLCLNATLFCLTCFTLYFRPGTTVRHQLIDASVHLICADDCIEGQRVLKLNVLISVW